MTVLVHPGSELIREPRLLVPRMQPLGPVKINRTHPVGNACVYYMLGKDLVDISGSAARFNSAETVVQVGRKSGIAVSAASTEVIETPTFLPFKFGSITVIMHGVITGNPANTTDFFYTTGSARGVFAYRRNDGGNANRLIWVAHTNVAAGDTVTAISATIGTEFVAIGSYRASDSYLSLNFNGTKTGKTSLNTLYTNGSPYKLSYGNSSRSPQTDIYSVGIFNTAFPDSLEMSLITNPYQFLIPA